MKRRKIGKTLVLILYLIFILLGFIIYQQSIRNCQCSDLVDSVVCPCDEDMIYGIVSTLFLNNCVGRTIYFVVFVILFIFNLFNIVKSHKKKILKSIILVLSFIYTSFSLYYCVYIYEPVLTKWKPILYLYPENETVVSVNFEHEDRLLTTYPKFKDEWEVVAYPNGDLYSEDKYYYALYWDEESKGKFDFSTGFYVEGDDAIEFLEEKLTYIGLNDREKNEFIMYWLPILEENEKSLVHFNLTEDREKENKLIIKPTPDSLLRVEVLIKKVKNKVNIKEQKLTTFNRVGFTAVEWGGTIIN